MRLSWIFKTKFVSCQIGSMKHNNKHPQRLRNSKHRPMLQAADPRNRLVELYKLRDPLYREVATHVIESDRDAVIRFVRWLDQEPQP